MPKILVVPVAFNENVKLKNVMERFLKSPARAMADYLVVDDASTDGTTEMIRSFADKGVKTIRHEKQRGVGAAIRTAIRYAQKNGYDILVIMAGTIKITLMKSHCFLTLSSKGDMILSRGRGTRGRSGLAEICRFIVRSRPDCIHASCLF